MLGLYKVKIMKAMGARWRRLCEGEGGLGEVTQAAWPMVVSMFSYTLMALTDTLVVGWLGKTELAAAGLATTLFFTVNALFLGTLHGVKVLGAQATGAGEHRLALASAWHGVALAVPFGLIVAASSLWAPELVSWIGGSPQVQAQAVEFFCARVMAAPFWYVFVALCDYYQARGDMRTPMKLNMFTNGLNVPLDLAMVFGFGPIPAMGMVGAAWATVLASAVGMLMLLAVFLREHGVKPVFVPGLWGRLVGLGAPMGARYALDIGGFAVFTSLLAQMGEDELAAHQVAMRLLSVSFLPGYGISEAACVLAGQYMGAGRLGAVRRVFTSASVLAVGLMGVFGLAFCLVPGQLIGLFQEDPGVLAVGVPLLYVAAMFQVFDAFAMVGMGALNGVGQTRYTMAVSLLAAWGVMLPLGWFLGVWLGLGAVGAWLGITAQILVLAVLMCGQFLRGGWARGGLALASV